jgi:hypothetical protein
MMDTAVTTSDALAVSAMSASRVAMFATTSDACASSNMLTGMVDTPLVASVAFAVSLSAAFHVRAAGAQNGVVQNALSANSIIHPQVKVGCPLPATQDTQVL